MSSPPPGGISTIERNDVGPMALPASRVPPHLPPTGDNDRVQGRISTTAHNAQTHAATGRTIGTGQFDVRPPSVIAVPSASAFQNAPM